MDKQKIKKVLADLGVLEVDLAKAMGISVEELNEAFDKNSSNKEFLKKIENALGIKNLFIITEYVNNSIVGNNNNSTVILQQLLDTIEKQNDTIKELHEIIMKLSPKLPDNKTRNKS